jgi:hypothetical protein
MAFRVHQWAMSSAPLSGMATATCAPTAASHITLVKTESMNLSNNLMHIQAPLGVRAYPLIVHK